MLTSLSILNDLLLHPIYIIKYLKAWLITYSPNSIIYACFSQKHYEKYIISIHKGNVIFLRKTESEYLLRFKKQINSDNLKLEFPKWRFLDWITSHPGRKCCFGNLQKIQTSNHLNLFISYSTFRNYVEYNFFENLWGCVWLRLCQP